MSILHTLTVVTLCVKKEVYSLVPKAEWIGELCNSILMGLQIQ